MKITVIGCFGAYPPRNGATSGYLVEAYNTKVLIDCGSGIVSQLQNYVDLADLDAVVFSHYHRDHCADLECLQHAAMVEIQLGKRKKPLTMWGIKGAVNDPRLSYKDYCIGRQYDELSSFAVGSLSFSSQSNIHDVPSYSLKVREDKGSCFVYSGDTGYYSQFCEFAAEADWLICECSLYAEQIGLVPGHLSSSEVGEIAKNSNVHNVMLTHLPNYGDREVLTKEVGRIYSGNVVLAHMGRDIRI